MNGWNRERNVFHVARNSCFHTIHVSLRVLDLGFSVLTALFEIFISRVVELENFHVQEIHYATHMAEIRVLE